MSTATVSRVRWCWCVFVRKMEVYTAALTRDPDQMEDNCLYAAQSNAVLISSPFLLSASLHYLRNTTQRRHDGNGFASPHSASRHFACAAQGAAAPRLAPQLPLSTQRLSIRRMGHELILATLRPASPRRAPPRSASRQLHALRNATSRRTGGGETMWGPVFQGSKTARICREH